MTSKRNLLIFVEICRIFELSLKLSWIHGTWGLEILVRKNLEKVHLKSLLNYCLWWYVNINVRRRIPSSKISDWTGEKHWQRSRDALKHSQESETFLFNRVLNSVQWLHWYLILSQSFLKHLYFKLPFVGDRSFSTRFQLFASEATHVVDVVVHFFNRHIRNQAEGEFWQRKILEQMVNEKLFNRHSLKKIPVYKMLKTLGSKYKH